MSTAVPATAQAGSSLGVTAPIVLIGALLWWGSETWPAEMPVFLPWDFSWIDFLGTTAPVAWYLRGLHLTAPPARPPALRIIAFLTGMTLLYTVTQTQFVYLAQHMFFINRLQQLGMHHFGPFLVALSWPGETIARGMPQRLLRMAQAPWIQAILRVLQMPVIAGALFVGLLWLWLQPSVHLPAMISPALYEVMNLSMIIDGLLFWFLIMDPRPRPLARHGYAIRLATVVLICFPEMLIGAQLTFTTESVYPYYDLCGRLMPDVGALMDQHLGGLIVWIPSSMMSSAAFLLIVNNLRLHEERPGDSNLQDIEISPGVRFSSNSWTGR